MLQATGPHACSSPPGGQLGQPLFRRVSLDQDTQGPTRRVKGGNLVSWFLK